MIQTFRNFFSVVLLLTLFVCSSCLTIRPVEYKEISNLHVNSSLSSPEVSFDLIISNPNNWGVRLSSFQSDVMLDNKNVGKVLLPPGMKIKRKSDVSIPVNIKLTTAELLSFLPGGLSLLSGEKKDLDAGVSGNMKISKFIFSREYSFKYTEKIKF